MAKNLRKALTTMRNRALGTVLERINGVYDRLDDLESHERHVVMRVDQIEKTVNNRSILQINEREMVAKIFSGLKMYLDPRDISVATHIALDGIWEAEITRAWQRYVKPEGVVFDVGANFGYFGALAAQSMNKKKSRVVLFEPNPNLLPYLDKTLSLNWLHEHAKVEHVGVAEKSGTVTLNVLKDYVGSSSMHPVEHLDAYLHDKMHLEVAEKVKVKTISIDEYCKEQNIVSIDLMKMDIEGYEAIAYQGMRGMVKQSPDLVFFIEFTKDSYDDPQGFYGQMLKDFGHVHTIDESGALVAVTDQSYSEVFGDVQDWKMLVFAKKQLG